MLSLMLWKDKTGADILVGGLAAAFGSVVGTSTDRPLLCAQGRLIAGKVVIVPSPC